jgi:hypothetical protein
MGGLNSSQASSPDIGDSQSSISDRGSYKRNKNANIDIRENKSKTE